MRKSNGPYSALPPDGVIEEWKYGERHGRHRESIPSLAKHAWKTLNACQFVICQSLNRLAVHEQNMRALILETQAAVKPGDLRGDVALAHLRRANSAQCEAMRLMEKAQTLLTPELDNLQNLLGEVVRHEHSE